MDRVDPSRRICCQECLKDGKSVYFEDHEDLDNHRKALMAAGYGHWICELCLIHFRSVEGWRHHTRERHPRVSKIQCPGCPETFSRPGHLMTHIENGSCPNVTAQQIHDRREEKLKFDTALHVRQQGLDPMMSTPVAGAKDDPNFSVSPSTKMMGQYSSKNLRSSFADLSKPNPIFFRDGFGLASLRTPVLQPDTTLDDKSDSSLRGSSNSDTRQDTSISEYDPDNRFFNPMKYYNAEFKKYKCPHQFCGKSVGLRGAFIAHLKSAAHNPDRMQCPGCCRWFSGIGGLTQHAESSTARYAIRRSDHYGKFMDMLTGGMVDVKHQHKDGTVQYATANGAVDVFNPKAKLQQELAEQAAKDAELKKKERYWVEHRQDILW